MAGYFFLDMREISNGPALEEYRSRVRETVDKFDGEYLIVGGKSEVVEGKWEPVFPVLLRFPTLEASRKWYDSEEYKELKELRLGATSGNAVFFESEINEFVTE